MRKAIAIDFDGCLCADAFPDIGEPNWAVIKRAQAEQRAGAGLILWTCREGELLQEAITACERWGLTFDAVNESLLDWIEAFKTRPRKVGATEYWDDKALKLGGSGGIHVESQSERDILDGCISSMNMAVGAFEEYLDYMNVHPETEEERFSWSVNYFTIVQRLFLWKTSHSGGTSTAEKCAELGVDCGEEIVFEDERE